MVPSKTYRKFTEVNDWEGETWHFFIPVEGNEPAFRALRDAIRDLEGDDIDTAFELGTEDVYEDEVDVLVKHGDDGYMPQFNKLDGRLVLPKFANADDVAQILGKGGVADLMEKK